jgi:hypothetical protein
LTSSPFSDIGPQSLLVLIVSSRVNIVECFYTGLAEVGETVGDALDELPFGVDFFR